MKANEFMGMMFLARDVAHKVHLSTRSFAKHMALDGFYHGIVDFADKFAEAYQGRYGIMKDIPLMSASKTENIVEFLESQLSHIEKNRMDICDKEDSALQNIVDEIIGLYLSTLYKLKFLS